MIASGPASTFQAPRNHIEPPSFGAALRAFRRSKGWSAAYIARRLGSREQTFRGWERGARPRPKMLAALARLGFAPPPRQPPCVMRRAA